MRDKNDNKLHNFPVMAAHVLQQLQSVAKCVPAGIPTPPPSGCDLFSGITVLAKNLRVVCDNKKRKN